MDINAVLQFTKSFDKLSEEEKDIGFQTFDNIYGPELGPKIFNLARQVVSSSGEQQLALNQELQKLITPVTQVSPEPNKAAAAERFGDNPFMSFATNMAAKTNPNPQMQDLWKEEAASRALINPQAATAGAVAGGVGNIASEMALPFIIERTLSGLPVGPLVNRMMPRSYEGRALGELIRHQGPAASAAIAGGITGATQQDGDPLQQAALGAVGAKLGDFIGHRIMSPASNQPRPTQELIRHQKAKGYYVTPGFASGRAAERQLDHAIRKNPLTAEAINRRLDYNRELFNGEVAEQIGLPRETPILDIDTLATQNDALNNQLAQFYNRIRPIFVRQDKVLPGALRTKYRNATGSDVPAEFETFVTRWQDLRTTARNVRNRNTGDRVRSFMHDLSNRMTWHYTNPNGDVDLARAYNRLHDNINEAIERRVGRAGAREWQQTREQQAFLIDLINKDKEVLIDGKVSPKGVLRILNQGKRRKLDYISRRREIYNSARFLAQLEDSFENSLSMGQRFGNYLNPKHRGGMTGGLADLTKGLPFLGSLPVETYLRGGPRIQFRQGLLSGLESGGGALGASGLLNF